MGGSVSCFDNILVVNPEERFTHDAAQKKNFIVAFYTMFVRYIYVLQKQNKINKT